MYAKSADTRKLIIRTTARLMNRKGIAATSIQDITSATVLTKGALYGHFQDKEALALDALDYNFNIILDGFCVLANPSLGFWERFDSICRFYAEHGGALSANGGCPFLNSSTEFDDQPGPIRDKILTGFDTLESLFRNWIDCGKEEGIVRQDVVAADYASLFLAMLEGGILLTQLRKDASALRLVLGGIQDICVHQIGA